MSKERFQRAQERREWNHSTNVYSVTRRSGASPTSRPKNVGYRTTANILISYLRTYGKKAFGQAYAQDQLTPYRPTWRRLASRSIGALTTSKVRGRSARTCTSHSGNQPVAGRCLLRSSSVTLLRRSTPWEQLSWSMRRKKILRYIPRVCLAKKEGQGVPIKLLLTSVCW